MIEAICLLFDRAPLDYAKAAGTWLLTGRHREEMTNVQDKAATATVIEPQTPPVARKFRYAITGLFFVLLVGPVFVFGAYTILTSLISL
jgi:hypothetical protein